MPAIWKKRVKAPSDELCADVSVKFLPHFTGLFSYLKEAQIASNT